MVFELELKGHIIIIYLRTYLQKKNLLLSLFIIILYFTDEVSSWYEYTIQIVWGCFLVPASEFLKGGGSGDYRFAPFLVHILLVFGYKVFNFEEGTSSDSHI